MLLRLAFQLLFIGIMVSDTFCEQDITIVRVVEKRNEKMLLKMKCKWRIAEKYEVGEASFKVSLNATLSKFKANRATVTSSDSEDTSWELTNSKRMKPPRFTVNLSGVYVGNTTTPVPTGTCSDLVFVTDTTTSSTSTTSSTTSTSTTSTTTSTPTTSTSTTSSTTTSTPTTSTSTTSSTTTSTPTTSTSTSSATTTIAPRTYVGVTHMSYRDGNCNRMYAYCDIPILNTTSTDSVQLTIAFNDTVSRFVQWLGTVNGDATARDTYLVENIPASTTRYAFKATYSQGFYPQVTCTVTGGETTTSSTSTSSSTTTTSTTSKTTSTPTTSTSTTSATTTSTPTTSTSTTSSTTTSTPTTSTSTTSSTTTATPTTSTSTTPSTTTSTPTTSTSTTSETTTIAPKTYAGVTHMSYRDGNCNRMYAYCDIPILNTTSIDSVQLTIAFNDTVSRFVQWLGTANGDATARDTYLVVNIPASTTRYAFKATYNQGFSPQVTCTVTGGVSGIGM